MIVKDLQLGYFQEIKMNNNETHDKVVEGMRLATHNNVISITPLDISGGGNTNTNSPSSSPKNNSNEKIAEDYTMNIKKLAKT